VRETAALAEITYIVSPQTRESPRLCCALGTCGLAPEQSPQASSQPNPHQASNMATAESSGPVNGNYGSQAYENSYATGASNFTPSQQPTAQPAQPASEIAKDEVGWYFVEQYYTTLSKSADRLFVSELCLSCERRPLTCRSSSTTSARSTSRASRRRRSACA
jgi:hypothetical protein